MENEALTIQPDYEVRIYSNGAEIAIAGLFIANDETVDVGMGIDGDTPKEVIHTILTVAGAAFGGSANWYDLEGLQKYTKITNQIKNGDIS